MLIGYPRREIAVANRTSQEPTRADKSWRYRVASCLTIAAIVLGLMSYLNRPTTNWFSAVGNDDLHQMFWLGVAAFVCLCAAFFLALYEFSGRHAEPKRDERALTRV